jgi:hypothetical protein
MINITDGIIAMKFQSRVTDDLLGIQYLNTFPEVLKCYARSLTFLHDARRVQHPDAVCTVQGNTSSGTQAVLDRAVNLNVSTRPFPVPTILLFPFTSSCVFLYFIFSSPVLKLLLWLLSSAFKSTRQYVRQCKNDVSSTFVL